VWPERPRRWVQPSGAGSEGWGGHGAPWARLVLSDRGSSDFFGVWVYSDQKLNV